MTDEIKWNDAPVTLTDAVIDGIGHVRRDGQFWVADDGTKYALTKDFNDQLVWVRFPAEPPASTEG